VGWAQQDVFNASNLMFFRFTDHTGGEALIVFDSRAYCPLLPLFSFAIYFTHSNVTLDIVRPVKVPETIKRRTPLDKWCSIRLELCFLSASNVDSMITSVSFIIAKRRPHEEIIHVKSNILRT
jgi:hypothetical protein